MLFSNKVICQFQLWQMQPNQEKTNENGFQFLTGFLQEIELFFQVL